MVNAGIQTASGAISSVIVIVVLQVPVFPEGSVAVTSTLLLPIAEQSKSTGFDT